MELKNELEVEPLKEKVERLSKGLFEYETPSILLSEDELIITAEAGKTYSGSFTIKNNKNTPVKGVLYSSSKLLKPEQDRFAESCNVIPFTFIADHMNAGETTKGAVCIVSDCGETQLPFTVNTEVPYFNSSLGKIKDLYNFANLAKSDWPEALKLFKSEEFKHLILHYETKYGVLYENLLKSRSASQALEEFLIAIHKKLRINISADKTAFEFESVKESFMDKIILTKDNWGYTEIRVSTDAPFISLDHKIIWSDNFIGNSYPLEFVLKTEAMRSGNNFGRVFLKTTHQTITAEITCSCKKREQSLAKKDNPNRRQVASYRYKLTENYLNFRCNSITLIKYVTDSTAILDSLSSIDARNQELYRLYKIHLLIISGKENLAEQELAGYDGKEEELRNSSVTAYCAYLYLKALLKKDEQSIENALAGIREYYNRGYTEWRLLWFLIYTDTRYDRSSALKLEDLKNQYVQGCRSPILYFEAAAVFNEDPSKLHELGDFELQVLYWGIRKDYLTRDAAIQITYLAGKNKDFNSLMHRCLVLLYGKYKLKDTLIAICTLLIKGHQWSNKYFSWFHLGVEEQLRITELHEYYMYSTDEKPDIVLPQPILLYFIYNSNINDRKKAYLYAYVVRNKDTIPNIYRTYYKHMEQFAVKQIGARNVSTNLSVLYEEIIAQEGLTEEIANELPYIMFKYEITCNNPNMKGVFVVHKETQEEVYTSFVNGTAQVDIYTENAEILLVDGLDNRYAATVEYTLNKLMHWEDYIHACFDLKANHPYLLLNLSEKVQNYQKFDDRSVEIRKRILQLPGLSEEYYNRNVQDLIYYYYDNFEGELLETYLMQINLHGMAKPDRDKIIELFIIRDLYEKALSALAEYGFGGVSVNRLMKLCTNLLQNCYEEDTRNEILVNLSYYIFKSGKYNEAILEYLLKYFYGTTREMFELWEAATAFDMETVNLEERLLAQMLFAESYLADSLSVFMQYYKRGCNHKLIKAFLSYNAYKYLVKDRLIQPELFQIMKREVMYEENEVCILALLKEFSKHELLTEAEGELADFNIHKFVKKGLVLPFFKDFKGKIPLPPKLQDKFYVEYKTNPQHKVMIHYRMEGKSGEEDFISEEMKNEYFGIYIKEFVVFYNERIQYYITEEDEEGQVAVTESVIIRLDHIGSLDEDTRYNRINFMLTAIDMQEEKTLTDSMCNYVKTEYAIARVFRPI